MNDQFDGVLLVFSMLYLGAAAGTYTALEMLSYVHPDTKSDEAWWKDAYVRRLLDQPLHTALFLWVARGVAIVLVASVAVHVSNRFSFGGATGALRAAGIIAFAVSAVYAPIAGATVAAVRLPQRFVALSKFFMQPLLLLLKPLVSVSAGALRKASPHTVEALSYRLLPLEQKIALFSNENGSLEEDEQKLVSSIFDFGDTVVREVMVPRIDMIAVNIYTSTAEALRIVNEAGHSRIPVYEETIDKIVGIVYTKDLLRKIVEGADFTLASVTRDVLFVPETKKIDDLLSEFKKQKKHIAIAVDEYGGTAGLITMEDVLEELVGDIQDEFDSEEELIERLDADSALCNAKVNLDDLKEVLGIELPGDEVDSLGGFLYETIGHVPRVGDIVRRGAISYQITSVARQRIDKVLIQGLRSVAGQSGGSNG
ncbi:MAG: HlyC/CorC family transporter [Chitinivibrionia bacterium]|nr:HlyC/CorC family transporter [Chitinivibrionia bacterium]